MGYRVFVVQIQGTDTRGRPRKMPPARSSEADELDEIAGLARRGEPHGFLVHKFPKATLPWLASILPGMPSRL